jgi:hypothetical protein
VLDPAAAYFSRGRTLAGTVSGALQVQGPLTAPNSLDVDLVFQDALVHLEDMTFRGRLALRTQLEGGVEEPSGPFEIDATEAQVEYGGGFVISKPRGTPATATGRLVREPDGDFDLRDLRLEIRNLEAEGKLRTGSRERLELSAPPFEIVGWGELVPALAPYAPTGRIAVPRLALVPDPLDLRGRIDLQDLRLRPPGRAPVTLRGAFEGHGASLGSSELEAIVAEQRVGLDLELRGLATTPRYRVRANTRGADTNALLGALAGLDDTLHGPLTADADLSGPLGGSAEPLAALVGRARLEIGRGRLKGVSILGDTLEGLGTLGEAALLAEQRRGSKSLQRFTGDEFESISGSFDLAGGRARTDDLRLVYRNYSVDLRGSLGFLDESLDLTGKLTIDEEVDAALAPGPGGTASRPKVIPLARVRGTLRSPRIELTREAVVALGLGYQGSQRREKWEEEIDERLGEGSGREVLDALEGILGGRRESPPR